MTHFALALLAATFVGASATAQSGPLPPGQQFIDTWDLNGDGSVLIAEVAEHRGDVFYEFDFDKDGVLTAEEYAVFDEARANHASSAPGYGQGMRRAATGMSLAKNDIDGDGTVTLPEFLGNSEAWFSILDRNADGAVTTDDFGRN